MLSEGYLHAPRSLPALLPTTSRAQFVFGKVRVLIGEADPREGEIDLLVLKIQRAGETVVANKTLFVPPFTSRLINNALEKN